LALLRVRRTASAAATPVTLASATAATLIAAATVAAIVRRPATAVPELSIGDLA
jgi:hypothetical protein